MSVVEDPRKVMQDFPASELRELSVRIEALEKGMNHGFETVNQHFEERFDAQEKGMDQGFTTRKKHRPTISGPSSASIPVSSTLQTLSHSKRVSPVWNKVHLRPQLGESSSTKSPDANPEN